MGLFSLAFGISCFLSVSALKLLLGNFRRSHLDLKEEMLLKHDLRKLKVIILKTSTTHIFHVLLHIRDNSLT